MNIIGLHIQFDSFTETKIINDTKNWDISCTMHYTLTMIYLERESQQANILLLRHIGLLLANFPSIN